MNRPPELSLTPRGGPVVCPYCRDQLEEGSARQACEACAVGHHLECWAEGGGCAVCVSTAPEARPRARTAPELRVRPAPPSAGTQELCREPHCQTPALGTFRGVVRCQGHAWSVVLVAIIRAVVLAVVGGALLACTWAGAQPYSWDRDTEPAPDPTLWLVLLVAGACTLLLDPVSSYRDYSALKRGR